MRFAACAVLLLLISFKSLPQTGVSDLTSSFAFQVNSIDDFMDRFNFRKNTGFQNYLKKNFPEYEMTRPKLVASLFNKNTQNFVSQEALDFVSNVTDSVHPAWLSYKDKNWYAELSCRVYYKSKPKNLTLVLKVEKTPNNGYRWSLVSAKAEFLKIIAGTDDSLQSKWKRIQATGNQEFIAKYSLSPVSHGIDFTNMDQVFENKAHVRNYLNREFYSLNLEKLILLVKKSEVRFAQVNKISYHFLQLDNWVLVVDNNRQADNAGGWRISRLLRTTPEQKEEYLKNQLMIQK